MEKSDEGAKYRQKLFASVGNVYVSENSVPPKHDLMQLVSLCGGQVCDSISYCGATTTSCSPNFFCNLTVKSNLTDCKLWKILQLLGLCLRPHCTLHIPFLINTYCIKLYFQFDSLGCFSLIFAPPTKKLFLSYVQFRDLHGDRILVPAQFESRPVGLHGP